MSYGPEKPVEPILRDTPDEGSSIPPKTSPEPSEELLRRSQGGFQTGRMVNSTHSVNY